jgi:signal peptidase II
VLPVAIGLLAGGAASNLFDRLTQGRVTDFLQISRFPVFNLADVAITVGVILLLLVLLAGERQARA